MNRWCKRGLLAVAVLLFVLLVWQLWPRPVNPLAVRAENVTQIRLTLEAHPELPDGEMLLTKPAELASFCALWNGVQAVPVEPYDGVDGAPTVQLAAGDRRQIEIAFCLRDGSTRTIEGLGGDMVYFDGHWCYASCGKAYGYQPVIRFTGGIEARAERIRQEETP